MEAKGYDSFQFVRTGFFCADIHDSEKSSDKAAEVEIKDAEEEEDADEPENFEETMDAASESEE